MSLPWPSWSGAEWQRRARAAQLREFNRNHEPAGSPAGGRFAHKTSTTSVGITSARPGREARAVFENMRTFEGELKKVHGISHVSVKPGLGAWEGGSEPTWVVSYRGNGAARRLLARTAKTYDQDGVLLLKPCHGQSCDPSVELTFEQAVAGPVRAAVHATLAKHGMGGWTWFKQRGKTVLRMVSVPAWGSNRASHLMATRAISKRLSEAGLRHTMRVKPVRAEALGRDNYDAVIGSR